MIKAFRDQWLDDYYFRGKKSSHIPGAIEGALRRKLDIIHVAKEERDLRAPPGNRFMDPPVTLAASVNAATPEPEAPGQGRAHGRGATAP